MKFEAIVFDLDHTLFDRFKSIDLFASKLYEKHKNIFKSELTAESFTEFMKETDKHFNHYGWDKVFDEYDKKILKDGKKLDREMFFNDFLSLYSRNCVPYPFTNKVLEDIRKKGCKIGLITNGKSEIQRAKVKTLGIEEYFDSIIVSRELGVSKPDPAIFYKMSENLGIPTEKMVYVGDHPICDYQGSKNADCKNGTFSNGYQPDNVNGKKLTKTGKTVQIETAYKYGAQKGQKVTVTQNVWKTSDGKKWIWDGVNNKYIPY